jgi:hypothetical protein
MDPETVSDLLDALSDPRTARTRHKELSTLRGIRGVPTGEIARIAAATWQEMPPTMADEAALSTLFGTAWEDGLVAIGLLATLAPHHPDEVLDIGRDWLDRTDDNTTGDALGWLVLGPALAAGGRSPAESLGRELHHRRAAVRRAVVMSGLAFLPEPVEGPAAAPLREVVGTRRVAFVESPATEVVRDLLDATIRDEDPTVRKAVRRLAVAWATHDPDPAEAWVVALPGGAPKMVREPLQKAARKGRRRSEGA